MRLLRFLLKRSKTTLAFAVLAGLISGGCTAAVVAAVNAALAAVPGEPRPLLIWGFVALLVSVPLARLVSQNLLVQLGQQMVYELRLSLSRQILSTPLRNLEDLGSHRLLVALTSDVDSVTTAVGMLPALSVNVAIILGCLVYMGWLSPQLLLGFLVFMALGVVTYRLPMAYGGKLFRESREVQDDLFGHFEALVQGNKELKLHMERRSVFLSLLEQTAAALRKLNLTAIMVFTAATTWGWMLFFIMIGLLLFVVPRFQPISREVLTGYTLLLLYLRTPLQLLLDGLPQMSRGNISLQKVTSLGLALQDEKPDRRMEPSPFASWQRLDLAGVSHSYRGDKDEEGFQVGPLDLAFRPGELVFLVGGNGSGKTTLAKLLAGLYSPESGQVLVDGRPVTEATLGEYRRQFTAVFSDFHLFDKLLGLEHSKLDESARRYLDELHLSQKVQIRGGVLSTTALSQGQRKRLALLTAYLENRPFYIFDEWAADQDPIFKEIFYSELLPSLRERGKAVLVISHDDAYYDVADRIVKLEYGQLVYDGPVSPDLRWPARGGVRR